MPRCASSLVRPAAKNLLAMDNSGASDPFVRAALVYGDDKRRKEDPVRSSSALFALFSSPRAVQDSTVQTSYVEQSLAPRWNETVYWDVVGAQTTPNFRCCHCSHIVPPPRIPTARRGGGTPA